MLRWIRSVVGRRAFLQDSRVSDPVQNISIRLSHTTDVRQALEILDSAPDLDLNNKAFGLRALARCVRNSKTFQDDDRIRKLQKDVLAGVNDLSAKSLTDLMFWYRTIAANNKRNLRLNGGEKMLLLSRINTLLELNSFANKQVISLVEDLSELEFPDTAYLDKKVRGLLNDPNELFTFIDLKRCLDILMNRGHYANAEFFKSVYHRILETRNRELDEVTVAYGTVRFIQLRFSWPKLQDLHSLFQEEISSRATELSFLAIRNILTSFSVNPEAPFDLHEVVNDFYFRMLKVSKLTLENDMTLIDYLARTTVKCPERVLQPLVSLAIEGLEKTLEGELSPQRLASLILNLETLNAKLSNDLVAKIERYVGNMHDHVAYQLSLSILKTFDKSAHSLPSLSAVKSVLESHLESFNLSTKFRLLYEIRTHPAYGLTPVLSSLEASIISSLTPEFLMENMGIALQIVNNRLWKARVRAEGLSSVSELLLQVLSTTAPHTDLTIILNFLSRVWKLHPDLVQAVLHNLKPVLSSDKVASWIWHTEYCTGFADFVHLLTLLHPHVNINILLNTVKLYGQEVDSRALVQYLDLLNTADGSLPDATGSFQELDFILKLVIQYPNYLLPFQRKVAAALTNIGPRFRINSWNVKIIATLQALKCVEVPRVMISEKQLNAAVIPYLVQLYTEKLFGVKDFDLTKITQITAESMLDEIRDKARLCLNYPTQEAQSMGLENLTEAIRSQIRNESLSRVLGIVEEIGSIYEENASNLKNIVLEESFERIKSVADTLPSLGIRYLSTLHNFHANTREKTDFLLSKLIGKWPNFIESEKRRLIWALGRMGYDSQNLYTRAIDELITDDGSLQAFGPVLISSIHNANLLSGERVSELIRRYASWVLAAPIKRLNFIDFGLVAIPLIRSGVLKPEEVKAVADLRVPLGGNMSQRQKYILHVALRIRGLKDQISGFEQFYSHRMPGPLHAALLAASINWKTNYPLDHCSIPFYFQWQRTGLLITRETNFSTYTGRPLGDFQCFKDAAEIQIRNLVVTPLSVFKDESTTSTWMKANGFI